MNTRTATTIAGLALLAIAACDGGTRQAVPSGSTTPSPSPSSIEASLDPKKVDPCDVVTVEDARAIVSDASPERGFMGPSRTCIYQGRGRRLSAFVQDPPYTPERFHAYMGSNDKAEQVRTLGVPAYWIPEPSPPVLFFLVRGVIMAVDLNDPDMETEDVKGLLQARAIEAISRFQS